jgi:hypothetical protein
MNQTPNLSLCQWDPEDRILREDFNNDNSKIDTVLGELQTYGARYVKLKEIVTEEDVRTGAVEVDVSDITFADWQYIHVDLSHTGGNITLRVNDKTNTCQYVYPSEGFSSGGTGYLAYIAANEQGRFTDRITLHVGRLGKRRVVITCGQQTGHCTDLDFQDLTKLVFSGTLLTGTTVIIWGEV